MPHGKVLARVTDFVITTLWGEGTQQIKETTWPSRVHHESRGAGWGDAPAMLPHCRSGAFMLIWPVSLSLEQRGPCSRSWSMCSKALHFPQTSTHIYLPGRACPPQPTTCREAARGQKTGMFWNPKRASSPRICGCRAQSDGWALASHCREKAAKPQPPVCI